MQQELACLHRARHLPGAPNIYGCIVSAGKIHIVMELIRGWSLQKLMDLRQNCIMSPMAMRHLVVQLATTLRSLHDVGVLHRDLKPSNIIIEDGTAAARLVDFGLAVEHMGTTAIDQGNASIHGWKPLQDRQVVRSVLQLGLPLNVGRVRIPSSGNGRSWRIGHRGKDGLRWRWDEIHAMTTRLSNRSRGSMAPALNARSEDQGEWLPRILTRHHPSPAPYCSLACVGVNNDESSSALRSGMRTPRRDKSFIHPILGSPDTVASNRGRDGKHGVVPAVEELRGTESGRATLFALLEDLEYNLNENFMMYDGIVLENVRTSGAAWGLLQLLESYASKQRNALAQSLRACKRRGVDIAGIGRKLWMQYAPTDTNPFAQN